MALLGSEVDKQAFEAAQENINSNKKLKEHVALRLQTSKRNIFKNMILPEDQFDMTICNPPFHSSKEEANKGRIRKNKT